MDGAMDDGIVIKDKIIINNNGGKRSNEGTGAAGNDNSNKN